MGRWRGYFVKIPLRKGSLEQRPISSNSPKCIFSAAWPNTIYNTSWEGALRAGLLLFPLHPAMLRQFQSLLYGSNYFRVNKGRGQREKGTTKRGKLLDIGKMPSAIMTPMLCYQKQGAKESLTIKTQCYIFNFFALVILIIMTIWNYNLCPNLLILPQNASIVSPISTCHRPQIRSHVPERLMMLKPIWFIDFSSPGSISELDKRLREQFDVRSSNFWQNIAWA